MKENYQLKKCALFATIVLLASCSKPVEDKGGTDSGNGNDKPSGKLEYPIVASDYMPAKQSTGDMIPDFSRVGYRWGDKAIPDVPVMVTLTPPASGQDATQMIQNAIDQITHGGAVLLKKGVYNVSGTLYIKKSGVILRGEGSDEDNGTVIRTTKKAQHDLIKISGSGTRVVEGSTGTSNILDSYVPCGQFWVRTTIASSLKPGDKVVIYRPGTQEWISDLKMDQIPEREDGTPIEQWVPEEYDLYSERVVTKVSGDTVHFENPVVMSIDEKYGGGSVLKYHYDDRISEIGIENMFLISDYSGETDEDHGWTAITIGLAEHCWVRNVTCRHFGFGLVSMNSYSKNVSVLDCACEQPISIITGSRRYSFCINKGELCLVKNCRSDHARHDFVTSSRNCGPNVFVNCVATDSYADSGPHHRWNVGTLYDNVTTDSYIKVQDRGNSGTGHGWAGANNVLWNCSAVKSVIVQSPWVSAYNYSIGTIGPKSAGERGDRPDGVWLSPGKKVAPSSLYEAQLELRKQTFPGGVMDVH